MNPSNAPLASQAPSPARPDAPAPVRRIDSVTLFGGNDLVLIRHRGQEYRLRITRQGKLILTK
ncbi:MAG TPA: hemin uptake protein HemP [Gammaproteobacteria bacterium]|nr:hemin uptake protein HemP [Gammaproteobacteria bacterium]